MKFSNTAWFQDNVGCGDGLGDGKVCGIDLVEFAATAGDRFRRVIKGVIYIRRVSCELSIATCDLLGGDGRVKNVWVCGWELFENGLIDAEVFRDDVSGGVC